MGQTLQTEKTRNLLEGEITFEQFINWQDEDVHAELVGGKVRVKIPATKIHQKCNSFLHVLISLWIERQQGGEVYHPPFAVRLTLPSGDVHVREPDILVLLAEHLDRLQNTYLEGPPDLIVEIVSKSSRADDRGEKFYEYEAAGVPEYWIVDPERKLAEFAQRQEDGVYQVVFSGSNGIYHSRVLNGFWLRVEWLWQQPPVWDVLKEWGFV